MWINCLFIFSNIVRLVAPNGIFKVSLIIIISTNTTKAEIVLTLKNSVQLKFQKTLQTTWVKFM
jgi:hypothetical protein